MSILRSKSRFLLSVCLIGIASTTLLGCGDDEVPEAAVATELYEGSWHGCLGSDMAMVIRFEGGQYFQGFAVYPGSDCATGGTHVLVSNPDDGENTGIAAPENVGTIATDPVTGVPSGFSVTTNTITSGIWAGYTWSWIMYKEGSTLYIWMPFTATFINGETKTTHATWDEWLTETEVGALASAVTAGNVASHSSGSGFLVKFTSGTL